MTFAASSLVFKVRFGRKNEFVSFALVSLITGKFLYYRVAVDIHRGREPGEM